MVFTAFEYKLSLLHRIQMQQKEQMEEKTPARRKLFNDTKQQSLSVEEPIGDNGEETIAQQP